MTLELILAHPEDTRLSELIAWADWYDIEMELEAKGRTLSEGEWQVMTTECRTVGDLAGLVSETVSQEHTQ